MSATTRKPKPSLESRVRKARAVARKAQADAEATLRDEAQHRSTRSRSAYRIKALGLDATLRALDGKE